MHKKFKIIWIKIKGGCQSGRKVATNDSKSDLPLEDNNRSFFPPFLGICCMGNGRGYRFRVVAEFGTCPGMRLCHHPRVIGQYPDMYDGPALRRTHFGKPSILFITLHE